MCEDCLKKTNNQDYKISTKKKKEDAHNLSKNRDKCDGCQKLKKFKDYFSIVDDSGNDDRFEITHFGGKVIYSVKGFTEKNNDIIPNITNLVKKFDVSYFISSCYWFSDIAYLRKDLKVFL